MLNPWVAHGQGSGGDMADHFSNTNESHQSSLGFYITDDVYFGKHGRSLRLDGMDEGFNSAARNRAIVVHAADVSSSDKEKKRKTDKVDALKLARNLANGDLAAIYVPDEDLQKERNLIRFRKKLVGDLNRSKNRLKSLLKYQGIKIPESLGKKNNWSYNFMNWVEEEAHRDVLLKDTLLLMLDQIKSLRQLLLKTERALRKLMQTRHNEKANLLMTAPGIGRTTAMLFLLEIGDIKRFGSFDTLNDLVGFCPDTDSSGDTERDRGITSRRHKQLRSALIEAAWTAIRIDPALMDAYQKLIKRMKGQHAIIRIARKLLRRMRAILISGIPYQKGVIV